MIKFVTVQRGSRGDCVLILQSLLRAAGYLGADGKPLEIDGVCGANTQRAITSWHTVLTVVQTVFVLTKCGKDF